MDVRSIHSQASTLLAFWQARWLVASLNTRAKLEAYQHAKLKRFLRRDASSVQAFRAFRNAPITDWPYMDKAALMANFDHYNQLGLTTSEAWHAFETGEPPRNGYAVGASTGTSGNRGLYVVSSSERYKWLGVILSRAIPDVLTSKHRVAVVLPMASRLYDAANESKHLSLKFFNLSAGIDTQIDLVADYNPTILVAPPKMLRAFAEADRAIQPERVFSGAEVLDPEDRSVIEARFNLKVREIYMATEGLFGVACEHGTLHLIEDHVKFEWEPVPGAQNLAAPIITDFSRRTQIMVRYRMNDLLERQQEACPCGSPHQAIRAIHGRQDDVLSLARADNSRARLTPDIIRNTVLDSDRSIRDFRVIQLSPQMVKVCLPNECKCAVERVQTSLAALFSSVGVHPQISVELGDLSVSGGIKLRRVMVEPKAREV